MSGRPSALEVLTRTGVAACRAALEQGLVLLPDDPFAGECRRILALLATADSGAAALPEPSPSGEPAAPVASRASGRSRESEPLKELAAAMLASPEGRDYLDDASGPDETPAELWSRVHLAALRLPEEHAADWRDRAAALLPPPEGEPSWRTLPTPGEARVLLPARPDLGVTGLRTAPGHRLPEWAVPDDLRPGDPLRVLVALAVQVEAVAGLDGAARRCLEHLDQNGMKPMADRNVAAGYREDLVRRVRLAARTERGPAELGALLRIDESVGSLLHFPPAAADSWWGRTRTGAQRAVLAVRDRLAAEGREAEVRVPDGPYPLARALTGGSDVGMAVGYHDGQVLACLRLWARIEGRVRPGRVVYSTG